MTDFESENKRLWLRIEELEKKLARSVKNENAFRSLVEGSQDIMYRTDTQGLITYISPSGYHNDQVLGIIELLKSGMGTEGIEFIPTTGKLLAIPMENVGYPKDTEAHYKWPEDHFSYGLEEIYTDDSHTETQISAEELAFAWKIVNSPSPLVESRGKVYWIAVVVPGISFL